MRLLSSSILILKTVEGEQDAGRPLVTSPHFSWSNTYVVEKNEEPRAFPQ